MVLSTCLASARCTDVGRLSLAPALAARGSRATPVISCSGKRNAARADAKCTPLVAVSLAAAATGILLPLDPSSLNVPVSVAAPVQEQAVTSDLLAQISLASEKAPALGLLADGEELSPAERARQLAADYRRKKEEEATAKAAAAAAQAEEAARAAAEEAAKAARSQSFFGARVETVKEQPVLQRGPAEIQKQEVQKPAKKSKRGGLPLFVSQFGVLAAYSGIVAAAFVLPESEWKKAEKKAKEIGEKIAPVIEEAVMKAKPVVEQAREKGRELLVEAKPYVVKAIETAKPLVAEAIEKAKPLVADAVEKAKPLVAQAGGAVASQINSTLNKKDEEKPSSSSNGAPTVTVIPPTTTSSSSAQSEAKL